MILNKILLQQADVYEVSTGKLPENITKLLQAISYAYDDYEKDRKNSQRTVALCSSEMIELYSRLRKESKELKTLFKNMREVFFSVNMQTNQLIQISQACETVYGYLIGDFMNNPNLWAELVINEDKHIVDRIAAKIRFGSPFSFSYRISRKDGCVRWLETKIAPTLKQGSVIRIDGFTSDITERKETEKLLQESELKLDTLVKNYIGPIIPDHKN